ncbi:uncharacterized protein LOC120475704 [Pimephales promelas]|uniref:uncharacterized protein LOC120475704 n=1 Tax=Pimephales promelas TaxID=90988 RepID=UPI0019556388|nr:uncharacterized protein LOC120475704 [Pimephales promelas]
MKESATTEQWFLQKSFELINKEKVLCVSFLYLASLPEPRWSTPPYYWTTSESSSISPFITTQHPWPGSSSKPCGYWYNKPCYWAITQPSHTSTTHYQTQLSHTSTTHYQRQTRPPYRRRLYVQTPSKPADAPEPNIAVYRQMQDREHVIVMCSFGRRFIESSFQLSVEGEHNYTLKCPLCYSNEKCVFDVKVSPPVSFTCVHEINSVVNRRSETYTYSPYGKTT